MDTTLPLTFTVDGGVILVPLDMVAAGVEGVEERLCPHGYSFTPAGGVPVVSLESSGYCGFLWDL